MIHSIQVHTLIIYNLLTILSNLFSNSLISDLTNINSSATSVLTDSMSFESSVLTVSIPSSNSPTFLSYVDLRTLSFYKRNKRIRIWTGILIKIWTGPLRFAFRVVWHKKNPKPVLYSNFPVVLVEFIFFSFNTLVVLKSQ